MQLILRKPVLSILAVLIYINTYAQDTLRFDGSKDFSNYVVSVYMNKYPDLEFFKFKLLGQPYSDYDAHRGVSTDSVLNAITYLSLINNLDISNCKFHPKINMNYAMQRMFDGARQNYVPLSIAFVKYSDFKDSAWGGRMVEWANTQFVDNAPSGFYPFQQKYLFASSALNQGIEGSTVNFLFNDSLFLSNMQLSDLSNLAVDFDDGNGFVNLPAGSPLSVTYSSTGVKTIQIRANFRLYAGGLFYSSSKITILSSHRSPVYHAAPQLPQGGPFTITTSILGTPVTGSYAVWYSTCNPTHTAIRKPYIISAGFNPGQGKQLVSNGHGVFFNMLLNGATVSWPDGDFNGDWRGTYYETYNGAYNARMSPYESGCEGSCQPTVNETCCEGSGNGNGYLDRLRDEGYDIIILMYANGTDYTLNNAALFMQLIENINTEKFANGYYFENVVSGYSAGGTATRLALALMEQRYRSAPAHYPNPHTKMWVSIETESQGANLPLGLQYFLDYQSSGYHLFPSFFDPLLSDADILNCVAANMALGYNNSQLSREVLRCMASANNGMDPARTNLLSTFANISGNHLNGYPEFCRRIGVSNGSSIGTQIPHTKPALFETRLKLLDASFNTTSWGSGACSRNYTWYLPSSEKKTAAFHWGSINHNINEDIFEGSIEYDSRTTLLPMVCIDWFGDCICTGPLTAGWPISFEKNVPKPTYNQTGLYNYDDVPASTQATHLELNDKSAYHFYNNWFAGSSYAYPDPDLHSFAPTASSLDLHDPNTGYQPADNYISPVDLGLMYIKPLNQPFPQEPNRSFGYPYIQHPADHYQITPYDAVYAIGDDKGTYSNGTPKPANQFHVEDPLISIGNYLARFEVAPEVLFLSNRSLGTTPSGTIQNNYWAEFEARDTIITGNGIYSLFGNQNYLTPDGDFNIDGTSNKAIIHAGNEIIFMPGTNVDQGAELDAYIQDYNCPNLLRRATANSHNGSGNNDNKPANNSFAENKKEIISNPSKLKIYPNPNKGLLIIENNSEDINSKIFISDITGKLVFSEIITNKQPNQLNLQSLEEGIYLVQVINASSSEHSKISITK